MCPLKDDLHFVIFDPETAEIVCSLWTTLRRPLRCNHHSCDMSSLMTNSLKFMQQMTLALSERDIVFVANTYCSPLIWKNCQKVKASAENVHVWYKHKVTDILCHSLVRALSMTVCCSPYYMSIIHCFSSLTSRILFLAMLHCFANFIVIEFRLELLRRPCILRDEFWGLTCNRPLKSAANVILKFHKVV